MSAPSTSRPRRHMRKGTHSCTECRRRKIRCILSTSNDTCNFCLIRGIRCIDQRVAASLDSDRLASPSSAGEYGAAHRSILETPTFSQSYSQDILTDLSTSTTHNGAPLVSLIDNSSRSRQTILHGEKRSKDVQLHADNNRICKTLRAALPSYDNLVAKFSTHGDWWDSFRQKTRVISQSQPLEPLASFLSRTFTGSNPGELGTVVTSYARCLSSDSRQYPVSQQRPHQLLRLVDNLVVSDPEICASIEAMECLILLAKTYTDIGQPRRAWITWRKGLATAQLMGLHRPDLTTDDTSLRIWSAIYHGDRFTSLLLGVAHGFSDGTTDMPHLPATVADSDGQWLTHFIHSVSIIAGRVSEQNATPQNLSFAKEMQLDEALARIEASAPPQWWDLPAPLPTNTDQLTTVVDKILVQFFFLHTRMYLHLPFLSLASPLSPSPSQHVAMTVCADACQNLLKRYFILRTSVNGRVIFDCATTDFIGFTAALVLLVAAGSGKRDLGSNEHDINLALVTDALKLFKQLEVDTGSTIASQSATVLKSILHPQDKDRSQVELSIPYFGKLLLSPSVCSTLRGQEPKGSATDSILETPDTTIADQTSDSIDISVLETWQLDANGLGSYGIGWDIDQDWHLPKLITEWDSTFDGDDWQSVAYP